MTNTRTLMMLTERGDILISDVTYNTENLGIMTLISPAIVVHERPYNGALGFMLTPWIPTELIMNSRIDVAVSLLKGTMVPSTELLSFYKAWSTTERDKWKHFGKEFGQQVTDIENMLVEKYTEAKLRRAVSRAAAPEEGNNELLLTLFEEDTNWGNTAITH
jgi:hypothetical protein